MKFNSSNFVLCCATFGLALTAVLSACGDESTTEVSATSGLDIVAKGDSLPECGSDNEGSMIFVTDSSAVYYCSDETWMTLNGKDGESGYDGANGGDGSSCFVKKAEDGVDVICGGVVVGTIKNGKDGENGDTGTVGEKGQNGGVGSGCTANAVDDGIEVRCGDTVVGTIKNGAPGKAAVDGKNGNSCSAIQDEKSNSIVITCETDDGKGVSYTIQNGTDGKDAYEIAKDNGFNGTVTEWLASLNGKDGKICSAVQNDAKTETIITCKDDAGKDVNYVVKNGENCSTIDNEDGSYTIRCAGSDDVTIKNGASAYEIAKELALEKNEDLGDFDTWFATLKGESGSSSCTFSPDPEDPNAYYYECDEWNFSPISNGVDGKSPDGCEVNDNGDGKVEVTCGEGADEKTVILYKAVCGTASYDPAKKACLNGELFDACGGIIYDPNDPKNKCHDHLLVAKGTMVDSHDEQEYNIVTLGGFYKTTDDEGVEKLHPYNEVWMAENLNYEVENSWCYNQGSGVPEEEYKKNCETYGRLYTWDAAKDACPEGWHLPSKDEWDSLLAVVGGASGAAIKLKSDSELWTSGGTKNTDEYGFSALPAGERTNGGNFSSMSYFTYFWSATESGDRSGAYNLALLVGDETARMLAPSSKDISYSVRCIKTKE